MSEWKEYKLGDVAEIVCGATPSTQIPDYWKDEIKWVTAKDVSESNGYKIYETERKISKLGFGNCSTKMLPKNTTILIARGATMGRCCMIAENMALNQTCYALIAKQDLIHSYYLFYLIKSLESHFNNISHGAIFNTVIGSSLKETSVYIPDIIEQKSIASVLSSLDDKIDLLHRQNKTLEALAETLFRQWFVEEAEDGWETGTLGDYGEFKNGINYSRNEAGNTTYGIINVRDVMGNKFIFKEAVNEINIDFRKAEPYLLQKFDIVIVRSASPGETALILENQKKLIYSGFTIRFRPHKEREAFFFFQLMQSIKKQLDIFSDGTTLKNLNQEILKNIEFQVPSFECIRTFNEKVEPMFDKISKNITYIRTLTRLRDTLLPKLMSGEVRINDE